MTPELVTYILDICFGIIIGLAISASYRAITARYLGDKLRHLKLENKRLTAQHRKSWQRTYKAEKRVAQLEVGAPWLKGATTEHLLRKRIKALESNMPKSVLRRLDAQLGDKPCDGDSRP